MNFEKEKKDVFGKVFQTIKRALAIFLIYIFIFSVCIYYFYPHTPKAYKNGINTEEFYSDSKAKEEAVLIDGRYEAYLARIDMINSANKTIDLACYTIHDGWTSRAIMGALVDAADRGVKVRILFDGMFNQNKDELKALTWYCKSHPNIEWKYYQMINLLKPWTLNNRLHDKFIIIDGENFMLGGRNIGNKYFTKDYPEEHQVRDRDVIILGQRDSEPVKDLETYYNEMWDSKAAEDPVKNINKDKEKQGNQKAKQLKEEFQNRAKSGEFKGMEQYYDRSVPVNKVSVISNPLGKANKYPVILETLATIAGKSKDIKVQSPYVVPSYKMDHYIKKHNIDYRNVELYTNSEYSSPNPMGIAGYLIDRKEILKKGIDINEYQKPGSIHGKSFIFDERLAVVGSFNLECRSSFLSTETIVLIDSPEFAEELQGAFDRIGNKSFKVQKDGKYEERQQEINVVPTKKNVVLKVLSVLSYPFRILI